VYKVVKVLLVVMDNRASRAFKVYKGHKVVKVFKALDLFGKVFGVTRLSMPSMTPFFIMDKLGLAYKIPI
jgi:hypothetical protein